jgi:hypothetical protein
MQNAASYAVQGYQLTHNCLHNVLLLCRWILMQFRKKHPEVAEDFSG